jgi:hypothetical protein
VSQNFAHSLSSGVDSPSSSLSQFDYGAPIDPALEGAGSSQMAAPNAFDGGQTYPPPVKAETSTFPSTADGQNQKGAVPFPFQFAPNPLDSRGIEDLS